MTFEGYQKEAVKFRTETANNEEYLTLGLIEEVGEAAGKLAKRRRDGVWDEKAFIKELGDILWFIANLADYYDERDDTSFTVGLNKCFEMDMATPSSDVCIMTDLALYAVKTSRGGNYFNDVVAEVGGLADKYGYTLEQVAEINLAKLRDRAARGQIHGNGDER